MKFRLQRLKKALSNHGFVVSFHKMTFIASCMQCVSEMYWCVSNGASCFGKTFPSSSSQRIPVWCCLVIANMSISQMLCVYRWPCSQGFFFVLLGCTVFDFDAFCLQEIANNLARLSIDALARLGGYLSTWIILVLKSCPALVNSFPWVTWNEKETNSVISRC